VFLLGAMQGAKLQPLIAACVDPAQKDCLPLCQMLIQSEGVVDKCQLRENRDGYTEIVVRFSPSCE